MTGDAHWQQHRHARPGSKPAVGTQSKDAGTAMTTITFPRPTPALLSMNDRHHWRRHAADVKAWRSMSSLCGSKPITEPFILEQAMVCCTFDVPDKRRRDPANYFATVKPIVDGLVDAGVWPDDTPEWVTVVEPVLRVTKDRPLMVTVTLVPR